MALGTNAGLMSHASGASVSPKLPAATTTMTPAFTALSIAMFSISDLTLLPRLALKTAGLKEFFSAHSTASMN